jgi:hypothetical protein
VIDWAVGWVVTAGAVQEPMVSDPFPVEESPLSPESAVTVNDVVPDGVALVVESVSVDIFELSEDAKLNDAGLKEAVTPVGREDETVSPAINAPAVVPLRFTVTA